MVRILCDSTADLTAAIKERVYAVVPLTVHFAQEEYIDGITITHKEFYEKLVESDVMPQTSQATPADFEAVLAPMDGDEAVVITLSSTLSGTYQSACIAAAERKNVYVVDSGTVAIGAGILVEFALQLADQGYTAAEIAVQLEKHKTDIHVIAMVDTLEYLHKGGRVSKALAVAGGLLGIKPVLAIQNGEITLLGKARGSKQGNNLLVQEIRKAGGVDFTRPILLGYTGLSDLLLRKYIDDSAALWAEHRDSLCYTPIGAVIGTHAGPGAVAVAFFADKKEPSV